MSLARVVGDEGNFEYRCAYLRDAATIAGALSAARRSDEATRYFGWMTRAPVTCRDVQIAYGVEGERDLAEDPLERLEGHADSRPARHRQRSPAPEAARRARPGARLRVNPA
jgi:GH15 family glucan-1,4-alpha-glucosidase